eukprot:SAG22_NODE_1530_length_4216_cov_5.617926_1_plen_67_part_10
MSQVRVLDRTEAVRGCQQLSLRAVAVLAVPSTGTAAGRQNRHRQNLRTAGVARPGRWRESARGGVGG